MRDPVTAVADGAAAILIGSLITGLTPSWVLTGLGAALMLAVGRVGLRRPVAMAVGAVACFALRVAAVAGRWNLPVPGR